MIKTLPKIMEQYLRDMKANRKTDETIEKYRDNLYEMMTYMFNNDNSIDEGVIANLYAADYMELWLEKLEGKLAASSLNQRLATLKGFYKFLVANRKVDVNVVANLQQWKVDTAKAKERALDMNEVKNLMQASENRIDEYKNNYWKFRSHVMLNMFLGGGFRIKELCFLQIDDIDFPNGIVNITHDSKRDKWRKVPLPDKVLQLLIDLIHMRQEHNYDDTKSLFVSSHGNVLSTDQARRDVKNLAKSIGIELTPHNLRHTFGTQMANANAPVVKVAQIMGHSNVNTTMNNYFKEDADNSIAALNPMFA